MNTHVPTDMDIMKIPDILQTEATRQFQILLVNDKTFAKKVEPISIMILNKLKTEILVEWFEECDKLTYTKNNSNYVLSALTQMEKLNDFENDPKPFLEKLNNIYERIVFEMQLEYQIYTLNKV